MPTLSTRFGTAYLFLLGRRAPSSRRFIATLKALKTPNVEDKLATLGLEPMVMTPAKFDAHVEAEIRINAAIINAAGIK